MSSYFAHGHLRSDAIILMNCEVPGQQLLDAVDGVIGDLFEYAAEVDLRIEPVKLGCSEQRIDRGCADAAGIRSTE